MKQKTIKIGEVLPVGLVELVKMVSKDTRDNIYREYKDAGKGSTLNAVVLGYENYPVKEVHVPLIQEIVSLALPAAKRHRRILSNGIAVAEGMQKESTQAA